jgi:hypothetical protein
MAKGRGNFGFNIGGGGGGIANLVQAPKVTPVRSVQFAPTPRPQIQRDEKDPKKQILGALLGASSPFLAEAGLAGLAKIPGLEDKLFKSDPAVRQEFGIVDPTTGTAIPTDPYLAEQTKLRQRVEAALPSTKLPRQKTTLGKGLSELLTYAPALAFADEDDGSVASFISAAQSGKKLEGALDQERLKAYLARETARGQKLADVGNFTRKISYSAVLQDDGTFAPIKRTALISPDQSTRYVLSQGDAAVDFVIGEDGSEVPVPKGQYFIRESLTLDDTDPGKPKDVKLWDTVHRQVGFGQIQFMQTPEGRDSRILLKDPRNRRGDNERTTTESLRAEFGDNWVPYDQELAELQQLDGSDPAVVKQFEGRLDRELATFEVANIASEIIPIAMEAETKPELLTDIGRVPGFLDRLRKEINSAFNLIETSSNRSVGKIIYDQGQDTGSSVSLTKLLLASNNFSQIVNSESASDEDKEAAKQELITALKVVQSRAKDQGVSNRLTQADLDDDSFQDIIVKRGLLSAGQLRLAYAAAAADGQTGTSLSDKDVINFLEQLGFGDTNAKLVGKKLTNFVKGRFQTFDDGPFRDLANRARSHTKPDIVRTNAYLVGSLQVPRELLQIIADPASTEKEQEKAAADVLTTINRVAGNNAAYQFVHDKENRRIRYVPILERLKSRELLYNRYMQDIFPHYGITEDEINLVGESDIDLGSANRRTRSTVTPYQPRIRVRPN